jgi:hypothetical protein
VTGWPEVIGWPYMGEPLVITADMLDPDDEVTETLRPAPMPTEPAPPPAPTTERKYEWVPVRRTASGKRCYRCFKDSGLCTEHDQPPPAQGAER